MPSRRHQEYNLSELESKILNASSPVEVDLRAEMVTVNGQQGRWVNKHEVESWRGQLPISQYRLNEDTNPEVIHKKNRHRLDYKQELRVKYLRPETPPRNGDIVIEEVSDTQAEPAPPVIIRQECCRPSTPGPVKLREEPPVAPEPEGPKYIRIPGKMLPPPARKVIVERMAPAPPKPQNIEVERWLPFQPTERRVIYKKAPEVYRQADPRNVVIQWDAPQVQVHQQTKHLGVRRMNTEEYRRRYGRELKRASEFPSEIRNLRPTSDIGTLWADSKHKPDVKLVGDLQALALIDLEREGLGHYRDQLVRAGVFSGGRSHSKSSRLHRMQTPDYTPLVPPQYTPLVPPQYTPLVPPYYPSY